MHWCFGGVNAAREVVDGTKGGEGGGEGEGGFNAVRGVVWVGV